VRRLPGSLFATRYEVGAAQLEAARGDAAGVAARVQAVRHGELPRFYRSMLFADLATAAWRVGLLEEARALLADAQADAAAARAPWARGRSSLLGAALEGPTPAGHALLNAALEASADLDDAELWTGRERGRASGLLARAIDARLGPPGLAERLLAACGAEVLSEAASLLASAGAHARATVAGAIGRAVTVEPSLLRGLLADADERVRHAAQLSQRRLAARPRPAISVATMGGFVVRRGGLEVPALAGGRGGKARALLAILVAAEGPVHREQLIEWLWATLPPERGLAALQTMLHVLRQALEPDPARGRAGLVRTEGETYRLALDEGDSYDADVFRRLAAAGRAAGTLSERLEALLAAEAADCGRYLPEWQYADWAASRRKELEQCRCQVRELLAEAFVETGQPRAAVTRYLQLLEDVPECERWHRGLMHAWALAGERGLALRQYHACRTVLREGLGVEPSPETRALYASLL